MSRRKWRRHVQVKREDILLGRMIKNIKIILVDYNTIPLGFNLSVRN